MQIHLDGACEVEELPSERERSWVQRPVPISLILFSVYDNLPRKSSPGIQKEQWLLLVMGNTLVSSERRRSIFLIHLVELSTQSQQRTLSGLRQDMRLYFRTPEEAKSLGCFILNFQFYIEPSQFTPQLRPFLVKYFPHWHLLPYVLSLYT